jgi:hypothetical protein
MPSSPELPELEDIDDALQVFADGEGRAHLRLMLPATCTEEAERLLTLLSCWWMRWIGQADCAFWWHEDAWHVHCQVALPPSPLFKPVLQDLLAIKNVVNAC